MHDLEVLEITMERVLGWTRYQYEFGHNRHSLTHPLFPGMLNPCPLPVPVIVNKLVIITDTVYVADLNEKFQNSYSTLKDQEQRDEALGIIRNTIKERGLKLDEVYVYDMATNQYILSYKAY